MCNICKKNQKKCKSAKGKSGCSSQYKEFRGDYFNNSETKSTPIRKVSKVVGLTKSAVGYMWGKKQVSKHKRENRKYPAGSEAQGWWMSGNCAW